MIGAVLAAAAGLVLLLIGSDRFVIGAGAVAFRMRVPAIVIGAVIVGFGTSAPEMLASVFAALEGSRDIAIANVVGSNIANMTLVLGAVVLVATPVIASRVLRREAPLTVVAMAALAVVVRPLGRGDGLLLLGLFVVAMVVVMRSGTGDDALADETDQELHEAATRSWRMLTLLVVGGLVGTVVGAQLLVSAAISIAERVGLAEGFVGFTLVALGTSLPELVTGVQAARKGEADLAIGNVMGSNLFNSLAIAGVTGLISPGLVAPQLATVSLVMVGVGILMWLLMQSRGRLRRAEGVLLLAAYVATIPLVA